MFFNIACYQIIQAFRCPVVFAFYKRFQYNNCPMIPCLVYWTNLFSHNTIYINLAGLRQEGHIFLHKLANFTRPLLSKVWPELLLFIVIGWLNAWPPELHIYVGQLYKTKVSLKSNILVKHQVYNQLQAHKPLCKPKSVFKCLNTEGGSWGRSCWSFNHLQ